MSSGRVDIARAAAEKKVAEAQIQQATEERDQVLLGARTRQAQRAQQQAQAATSQVQQLQQELAALKTQQTSSAP